MAPAQDTAYSSSSEHLQGLTPPDSPTNGSTSPYVSKKSLRHLFEKVLSDLTEPPNSPALQQSYQPGPDAIELQRLLMQLIRNKQSLVMAKPVQSCSTSNEQEATAPVSGQTDLCLPICTTPDDFKSFEKWASAPQMRTIVETWDKEACKYKITEPTATSGSRDDYAEYVFVVRERTDRRSEEITPYIDIKSEGLRDILREVLHDIKAVSLMEEKPSIERNMLFHFLPELEKCAESKLNHSYADVAHLCLLIDHIKRTYATTSERLDSMLQHGHITFDLLWALFKPGFHIYTTCLGTGEPRCVIFDAGEETTQDDVTFFKLECRFLDYDGVKFGEAGVFLSVLKFRGSKQIKTLEAFPLCYHPSQQIRRDLVKRGQKFRDLACSRIQHCNGSAFFMSKGKPIKMNVNSRVGVDAAFFHKMQPNYSRPTLRDIVAKNRDGISVFNMDALLSREREREKEKMQEGSLDAQELREADFLIACPTVPCFSFKEKIFLECAVGALEDVHWSPESFDCLRIRSTTKTLLTSLAKTRLDLVAAVPFDDVIDGKGRGLNVLLHGPPGVGKTFTVEVTAERFKIPLYSISAGELVVDHGDSNALEQQLETIFKIAKHFNSVLLLDEADAFMEQRTSYHDTHNRLVTVFLRKLEYYQGILFLTTNRMIQFDDAIISRIHLTIKYEGLTREFRREIWKTQLSRARTIQGPASVKDDELEQLDNLSLNGREIKNLTSIAHALATVDGVPVSYKHLERAAESSEKLLEKFSLERSVEGMYV